MKHNIASNELGPNNPELIRATEDMEFAGELLRLRESQLDEQWRDQQRNVSGETTTHESEHEAVPKSLEHQLERRKQEEQLLQAELRNQKAAYNDLFNTAETYNYELIELRRTQGIFNSVQQRLDQKRMERSNTIARIERLSEALGPSEPHKDRRVLYTAIVVILCSIGLRLTNYRLRKRKIT